MMTRLVLILLALGQYAAGTDMNSSAVATLNEQRGMAFLSKEKEDEDAEDEDEEFEEEAVPLKRRKPASSKSTKLKSFADSGFCCHDGGKGDVCNTCYERSMEKSGSFCASEDKCGSALCGGGVWCKATCVLAGADEDDWCSSAYEVSIAKSSSFCAQDSNSCAVCRGQWCAKVKTVSVPETESPAKAEDEEEEAQSKEKTVKKGADPFCCFSSSIASDACGTCYPDSIAQDYSCTTSAEACAACSGVWCLDKSTVATLPEPAKEPREDAEDEEEKEQKQAEVSSKAASTASEEEEETEDEDEGKSSKAAAEDDDKNFAASQAIYP